MEKRARRPRLVTITAAGLVCLSAASFLQAGEAIAIYSFLNSLPLSAPAWYFLVGGIFWGSAWLASAFGLWRMKRWGIPLTIALLPIHLAIWLADRLFLDHMPAIQNALSFDLTIRLTLAICAALALLASRRATGAPVQLPQPDYEGK